MKKSIIVLLLLCAVAHAGKKSTAEQSARLYGEAKGWKMLPVIRCSPHSKRREHCQVQTSERIRSLSCLKHVKTPSAADCSPYTSPKETP